MINTNLEIKPTGKYLIFSIYYFVSLYDTHAALVG